jgi:hypothetical protein
MKLSYIYNNYLKENLIRDKSMRFQKKASKINYLAYINNLIIKAILKKLELSTYKNIVIFLNRVQDYS